MRRLIILAAALGAIVLAGCGYTHGSSNASSVDQSSAGVFQMPNGFRNVAEKCDGLGFRMYVTSAASSDSEPSGLAVMPDARCKGYAGP